MNSNEQRPNVERILAGLKDFQRQSVEYVYRRLYEDPDKVNRFLIADEVGLGKTFVARGLIAKAVDQLWDQVQRIDIIYICANQDIARQNVNRLNITPDREMTIATRMTLLPLHLHQFQDRKLNFASFTPGTSFDLRSSSGLGYERALLYHILKQGGFFGNEAGPKNLFQCGMGKENWRDMIGGFPRGEIDWGLAETFRTEIKKRQELITRLGKLIECFSHYRYQGNIPKEERQQRDILIGDLRRLLAESCVHALEPDIVILDEFQRFKYLLERDAENEVACLAQALFNFKDTQARNAKIILLSATPYKMYTAYDEAEGDEHYKDFIQTADFLFNSKEETKAFKTELERYRKELYLVASKSHEGILQAKEAVEKKLRKVMIRTERLSVTGDRNGMLVESRNDLGHLSPEDIKAFAAVDRVATALEANDPLEYWKSVPYLLNLMDDSYQIKRKLVNKIEEGALDEGLRTALAHAEPQLLNWAEINSYRRVDPTNAKLRTLTDQSIGKGAWKLLWIPPSLPYYELSQGPYSVPSLKDLSKALVFSSWQVVPKVIATLCSYEAERQMVSSSEPDTKYEERRKRKGLINFTFSEARHTGMANFSLIYPCLSLASLIDPLEICTGLASGGVTPSLERVIEAISGKIQQMIAPLIGDFIDQGGREDERWYWAVLAQLDAKHFGVDVRKWFETENNDLLWSNMLTGRGEDEGDSNFGDHIAQFQNCFFGKETISGKPPSDLVDVLAKVALASPAVTALRALWRSFVRADHSADDVKAHLLAAAARIALGFRSLFNRPDSIAMIRSLRLLDESRFWENALDYCVNGNLQSVMEEYIHVLREAQGLVDAKKEKAFKEISNTILEALSLKTVPLSFDEFQLKNVNEIKQEKRRLRCSFALRFGDEKDEEGGNWQGRTMFERLLIHHLDPLSSPPPPSDKKDWTFTNIAMKYIIGICHPILWI
ncbi:MAG: DEAD/DEAH box helicase [Thermodesulfobacteriota bacterium]|nr:DEAD/DEAH box helicase [Thermodesulfobacteriota bacterium]